MKRTGNTHTGPSPSDFRVTIQKIRHSKLLSQFSENTEMSGTHENEVIIINRLSRTAPRGCTRPTAEQLHPGAYTQVAQDGR